MECKYRTICPETCDDCEVNERLLEESYDRWSDDDGWEGDESEEDELHYRDMEEEV